MNSLDSDHPQQLIAIESLKMPIGALSSELTQLVKQASYFSFSPNTASVFTSNQYDVSVTTDENGVSIAIADPECGEPDLSIVLRRDNQILRRKITRLCAAMRERKEILLRVMIALSKLNPNFPTPDRILRFKEISDICKLHVTTVARALENKICLTPSGVVMCSDLISHPH